MSALHYRKDGQCRDKAVFFSSTNFIVAVHFLHVTCEVNTRRIRLLMTLEIKFKQV